MSAEHVRVRAGGEDYAVPAGLVREVDELGTISPVPGAPAAVVGVRNVRGRIVPVLELATLLGLARGEPERVVIVEHEAHAAALAVDAVLDVAALPSGAFEPDDRAAVAASVLVDGALVGILDVAALLDGARAGATT